jgi:hypothetical protein
MTEDILLLTGLAATGVAILISFGGENRMADGEYEFSDGRRMPVTPQARQWLDMRKQAEEAEVQRLAEALEQESMIQEAREATAKSIQTAALTQKLANKLMLIMREDPGKVEVADKWDEASPLREEISKTSQTLDGVVAMLSKLIDLSDV